MRGHDLEEVLSRDGGLVVPRLVNSRKLLAEDHPVRAVIAERRQFTLDGSDLIRPCVEILVRTA